MKMTARLLAAVPLVAAFAVSLLAQPVMPEDFRLLLRDDSGKTWRETGEFAMSQDAALVILREAMKAQGYAERFDIGGDDGGNPDSGHVMLWIKGDEEIIVSLWKKSGGRTGCSWGVSLKSPSVGGKPLQPEQGTTTKKEKTKDGQQY